MAQDLDVLEDWIAAFLNKLQPAARRKFARTVGLGLRDINARRIAEQTNPDGTPFAPRKKRADRPPLRAKRGRLKRRAAKRKTGPMFRKLRQASHLKVDATASEVSIGFPKNATSRIALVHQEGRRDRVSRRGDAPSVTYPRRVLLGVTDEDRGWILDQLLAHIEA